MPHATKAYSFRQDTYPAAVHCLAFSPEGYQHLSCTASCCVVLLALLLYCLCCYWAAWAAVVLLVLLICCRRLGLYFLQGKLHAACDKSILFRTRHLPGSSALHRLQPRRLPASELYCHMFCCTAVCYVVLLMLLLYSYGCGSTACRVSSISHAAQAYSF
jgi:hypothetical protein